MAKIFFGDDGAGANFQTFSFAFLNDYKTYGYHFLSVGGYNDTNNRFSFEGDKLIYRGVDGQILLDPTEQGKPMADIVGGSIKSFFLIQNGVQTVTATGLGVPASTLYHAVVAENDEAIKDILLWGDDNITGTRYGDVLEGRGGNDVIYGMAGNDIINGGLGADTLWGGSGRDTFVYKSTLDSTLEPEGQDTIKNYTPGGFAAGGDRISLSAIDANMHTVRNDAFTFVGTKAFSGKAGELRYEKQAHDTFIYADVNGDKVADMAIHLDYAMTLSKADFIL